MKLTKEERTAIMGRLLPKVFAEAARAKDHGIDIVGQTYSEWQFKLYLEEAESLQPKSRSSAAQEPQQGQKGNPAYAQ